MGISTIKSVLSTSSSLNGWVTNYSWQRKVFFMAGLWWVFYSTDTQIAFRTSANGTVWSAATNLRINSGAYGHRIGFWFDGTYLHYGFCDSLDGQDVFYRRYTPHNDGTLTPSAAEQLVFNVPGGKNVMYPKVCVDSGGYPWVSYTLFNGGVTTPPDDGVVVKSSTNDGTFVTDAGFPFVFYTNPTTFTAPVGVPLTGGKVYFIYHKETALHYYGNLWTGAAWGGEENATTPGFSHSNYNLVSDGDDVHMVYLTVGAPFDIKYVKRTFGVGWGVETTVVANAAGQHIGLTLTAPNSIILVYQDSPTANHIYYLEMVNGVWSGAVDWLNETVDGISNVLSLNAITASISRTKLALAYGTKGAIPFNVNFAELVITDPNIGNVASKLVSDRLI